MKYFYIYLKLNIITFNLQKPTSGEISHFLLMLL